MEPSHTVFILDDEINILNALRRVLRREPYQLAMTTRGAEALAMVQENPPAVIVSDYLMPEMNGLQFILEAKKIAPDAIPLILSGCADMDALTQAIREGGVYNFIPKPWDDEFLKIEIKRAVAQFDLSQKNKALLHRLAEEHEAAVDLLALLPQATEPELCAHLERVKVMALTLGRKVGLNQEALKDLEVAARLHDFGNLAIPNEILTKPGRLTPEERKEVEKHVLFPEEQLKRMKRLNGVCKIIRHHHEFYDGGGYPDSLQGEAIPLSSRILFIAEVYDALISNRPFRKAFTKQEALTMIKEDRGKQFDPNLVDLLLEMVDS